jgi:4-hydroxythreonine-4-phosphate dehydrogenase
MSVHYKPVIGISCGDLNGIGIELIIKTFSDNRMLEICTPVIFASAKSINFYRKTIPEYNFNFNQLKELERMHHKQVNLFNCWDEEVAITPGQLNETGGRYAVLSLTAATTALKNKHIDGLVTAPIHKNNVQAAGFNYSGHTPFLKHLFNAPDVLMLMTAQNMRVGLVTEHVPVADAAKHITKAAIISKLQLLKNSLVKDFGVDKPKIAVLGLNPHAGDEGLIGKEEEEIIKPALKDFKQNNNAIVLGPYSADAFFARGQYEKFDAVLAMYHDQGLIPFKSLALGEGVNYTAGLPIVRTSPDHGTAFDIAGKNKAGHASFIEAVYCCADIIKKRAQHIEMNSNPLKKMTSSFLANAVDEKIEE